MLYFETFYFLILHSVVSCLLSLLILLMIYIFTTKRPNVEKVSPYECGFKPFDYGYFPFDVHFYRVGILFLLFDVEILFFFPWLLNFYEITLNTHYMILLFVVLLFI